MSATNHDGFTTTTTERTRTAEVAAASDEPGGEHSRSPAAAVTRYRRHRGTADFRPAGQRWASATDPPADDSPTLPSASALICALAGQYLGGVVCRHAHELVEIHRRTRAGSASVEQLDVRRADLVDALDRWARCLPSGSPAAHANPDSLGTLIDRIADVAAVAFHLLRTDEIGGERMHRAWTRLAELELEYADLVRDIAAGTRYLPSQSHRR